MRFEDLHFMSLGSNCAALWYLGSNRVHGPIDNFVIKTHTGTLDALDNNLINKIYNESPNILEKKWKHSDDLNVILDYKDFKIVHNNPNTEKFKAEFSTRTFRLKNFIKDIQTNNKKWLVFNLNTFFVNDKHEPTEELLKLIENLNKRKLLNKTIFIQLFKYDNKIEDKWKSWINIKTLTKLNINTINIIDVLNIEEAQLQFKNQIIILLQEKGVL